jgi:hypothetical protein
VESGSGVCDATLSESMIRNLHNIHVLSKSLTLNPNL